MRRWVIAALVPVRQVFAGVSERAGRPGRVVDLCAELA